MGTHKIQPTLLWVLYASLLQLLLDSRLNSNLLTIRVKPKIANGYNVFW